MFNLKVLIFVAFGAILINSEEEKAINCPYLAACLNETEGKIKYEDVIQVMSLKTEKEFKEAPNEVLCVLQCALQRKGVLKGESMDLKKLAADEELMKRVSKKEEFIECIKIIKFETCDSIKEYLKCNVRYK